MNYMLLMKKISEEVDVNNEDTLAIKKVVSKHSLDIDKEEYEKKLVNILLANLKIYIVKHEKCIVDWLYIF